MAKKTLQDRALEAAVKFAKSKRLPVEDPTIISNGSNLLVHLAPLPVVARVATVTAFGRPAVSEFLDHEVELALFLSEQGFPSVGPAKDVDVGPHKQDGFTMTLWEHIPFTDGDPIAPAEFATMLHDLHTTLAKHPAKPAVMKTPLYDINHYFDTLKETRYINADDSAWMRDKFEDVTARLDLRSKRLQTLHGDAHSGNMIRSERGWLWNDFEDTCTGPVEWDLACLAETSRMDGWEAVHAYPSVPTDAELKPYVELRKLQKIVFTFILASHFPARFAPTQQIFDRTRAELEA